MNYANYLPDNKKYLNCSLSCTIDSLPKEIIESLNSAIIADQLTQYPKNEYEEMIETIRKMYNIKSIVLGTGSEDLICKINQICCKGNMIIVGPTFYRTYETAKSFKIICPPSSPKIKDLSISELENIFLEEKVDYIWIANPNSISGQAYLRNDLLSIISQHPETLFLIDETSLIVTQDFVEMYSVLNSAEMFENVIVIRSFSKFYGFPGLRLGFACGCENILRDLKAMTSTYPISSLSTLVVEQINRYQVRYDKLEMSIIQKREKLAKILEQSRIGFYRSVTNTLLLYLESNDKNYLWHQLCNAGILSLNLSEHPKIRLASSVRMTICTDDHLFQLQCNRLKNVKI